MDGRLNICKKTCSSMKWFGNYFISTLTFAKTYFATFCFVLASLTAMSFTNTGFNAGKTNDTEKDKNANDTTTVSAVKEKSEKEQFASLIMGKTYDAAQPYIAQLHPKAVSFIKSYEKKQRREYESMKVWGKPYFKLYDRILAQYNLPLELKYLSVIESHLRPGLVSYAGAVGPWQLMIYEAKRFKLKVNKSKDERSDFTKSTHVAAKLLSELYDKYDDWLLVVGAYNCGMGRMNKAIKQAGGKKDFWAVEKYLPLQTRNHVKKFIATHYIFEGKDIQAKANARKAPEEVVLLAPPSDPNLVSIYISGKYNSKIIAKHVNMDRAEFNNLNEGLDKTLAEGKGYKMQLPIDNMDLFSTRKNAILQESIQLLLHNKK